MELFTVVAKLNESGSLGKYVHRLDVWRSPFCSLDYREHGLRLRLVKCYARPSVALSEWERLRRSTEQLEVRTLKRP